MLGKKVKAVKSKKLEVKSKGNKESITLIFNRLRIMTLLVPRPNPELFSGRSSLIPLVPVLSSPNYL